MQYLNSTVFWHFGNILHFDNLLAKKTGNTNLNKHYMIIL